LEYKLDPYGFEYGFLVENYLSNSSNGKLVYNQNLFEREAFCDTLSGKWRRPQRPPNVPYEFILSPLVTDEFVMPHGIVSGSISSGRNRPR
jgi:hypothetical protein